VEPIPKPERTSRDCNRVSHSIESGPNLIAFAQYWRRSGV
jgi:hypothetical protein